LRLRAAAAGAAIAAALVLGCGGAEPPRRAPAPLPTVDVSEAPDAHASLENEAVEKRRAEPAGGIAGRLPEGFPRDQPLPTPSSLVDFGRGPHGGASVTLEVQRPPERALADYESQLAAAGFERGADGLWVRGARRLGVGVAPFAGIARISVEVVPAAGAPASSPD
jgi:hypothetical protein